MQYIRGTSPEDKQRILPLLNSLMKRNNGVRGLVSLLSFPNDDAVVDQAVRCAAGWLDSTLQTA